MTWQNNLEQGMQVPGLTDAQLALISGQSHVVRADKRDKFVKYIADVLRGTLEITDSAVWRAVQSAVKRYGRR